MRKVLTLIGLLGIVVLGLPLAARAESKCTWLAGDFHVHTVASHDVWEPGEGPSDDFYTYGWTAGQQGEIAKSRGLDFIAITDHDNEGGGTFAQDNPNHPLSGWGSTDELTWVRDYENSVAGYGGHAQMHGASHVYSDEGGPAAIAERLVEEDNGAFQINHPDDGAWHDADGEYLFGDFAPHALEVWNIGAWFYEPPMPATNDHEFPLDMYDFFLDRGDHVAATGGSDNHWRATTAIQGVGQPTTWVCATENSEAGIIAGIKANRTMISNQPPAYMGPTAELFADGDGDGKKFEAMLGDTVLPGSPVRAEVDNAEGATLRLVGTGGRTLTEVPVTDFNFEATFDSDVLGDTTWVRAEVFYQDGREARRSLQPICDLSEEFSRSPFDDRNLYCENRLAMVAMTSPIYFEEPDFDPTTTLTYVGDTTAKVGDHATFAAVLTDSNGDPLVGQPITFTFRNEIFNATTDYDGRASATTRVTGPPGEETVYVDFARTDTYSGSHLEQVVRVTDGRG